MNKLRSSNCQIQPIKSWIDEIGPIATKVTICFIKPNEQIGISNKFPFHSYSILFADAIKPNSGGLLDEPKSKNCLQ